MVRQLKKTISINLLRIRTSKRFSQREIAEVLSIKQPSYREMELGKTAISAAQLGVLADFYKVSILDFYATEKKSTIKEPKQPIVGSDEDPINKVLKVYSRRIEELEEKVRRKDVKIESLLAAQGLSKKEI